MPSLSWSTSGIDPLGEARDDLKGANDSLGQDDFITVGGSDQAGNRESLAESYNETAESYSAETGYVEQVQGLYAYGSS